MAEKKGNSDVMAILVVVIIAAVCAAGLAFVKQTTAPLIAEAKRQETLHALQKVVPEGCMVKLEAGRGWPEGSADTMEVFPGYDADGLLCGLAVKTRSDKGYSGKVVLVAGFSGLNHKGGVRLNRIYVTEHAETPGLGSLVTTGQDENPDTWGDDRGKVFGNNFKDKLLKKFTFAVKKAAEAGDNDVVAVTAATISSRAVTDAVQRAAELVTGNLEAMREAYSQTAEAGGVQ
jgi:Na+-translocating ferredoxin:NAD+ oxidoreductase subunit G